MSDALLEVKAFGDDDAPTKETKETARGTPNRVCHLTHTLPPFVLIDLITYLPVSDIARLSATTSSLAFLMKDDVTWRVLQQRDFHTAHCYDPLLELFTGPPTRNSTGVTTAGGGGTHHDPTSLLAAPARPSATTTGATSNYDRYKVLSVGYRIDQVKWSHQEGWNLSAREGHDQCKLDDDTLFLRFGFTNDSSGWVLDPRGPVPSALELQPVAGPGINGIYGHKISLFETEHSSQQGASINCETLVQFGGSTQGGYRGMTASIVVMQTDREAKTITDLILNVPHSIIPGRAYHCQHYDRRSGLLYVHGGLMENGTPDNKFYTMRLKELVDLAKENKDLMQLPAGHADRRRIPSIIAECVAELPVNNQLEPRFGHSMVAMGGGDCGTPLKLYIAGGYTGSGMFSLMDGEDLTSIWEYNTESQLYRCIVTRVGISNFLGRCHTAAAYGPLILYFGGTTGWSDTLSVFDTRTEQLYQPSCDASADRSGVLLGRTAHCMTLIGTKLFVTGGCLRERPMFRPQVGDLANCVTRALCTRNTTPGASEGQDGGMAWSPPMCTPISRLEEAEPPRPQPQRPRFGGRGFAFENDEDADSRPRGGGPPMELRRLFAALTAGGGMTEEQAQILLGRLIVQMEQEEEKEDEEEDEGVAGQEDGNDEPAPEEEEDEEEEYSPLLDDQDDPPPSGSEAK